MIKHLKETLFLRYFIFLFSLWAMLVCCPANVLALDQRKAVTQYVHDVWTSNDGLPQDSINAIVQTRDGYIWFATQEGLVRFDGVQFTVFDASNTEGMGNFVFTLFAARDGTLWVGAGGK
jgi:ligand-binding sensor domain-containing protein